jgi:hypothetical protein
VSAWFRRRRVADEGTGLEETAHSASDALESGTPGAAPQERDEIGKDAPRVHSGALPRTTPQERDEEPKAALGGYRTSRRSSRSGKKARKAEKAGRARTRVGEGVGRAAALLARMLKTAGGVTVIVLALLAGVYLLAIGINSFARWNAQRLATQALSIEELAKDNLLIIGVDAGQATGFTALKAERPNKRVLGIAIPAGAFVEVPGQGFERIAESYLLGPAVSKDAVTNYLGVPFQRYVVVDDGAYQSLLKNQDVGQILDRAVKTDLPDAEKAEFRAYFTSVKPKDVWIVPLPVKAVSVGDQQYFEPQRDQVADLLLQWWGVRADQRKSSPRVIVYNGVGTPGIAGKAAQQLIRKGFQVVDSGNAPEFGYKTTLVLLYHGTEADAKGVRDTLGVGEIKVQSAPQAIADIIVIIGEDYQPPAGE